MKSIRVLQITDTHLFADADGKLLGFNTRNGLQAVVSAALETPAPDLVVASGDLTHDGSMQAYQAVRQQLERLDAPVFCLPGNHDEGNALREHMNQGRLRCISKTLVGNWQLVFLDSTVIDSDGGHLQESELAILENALREHPDKPTLVCLHHQPVPVGSRWLDGMAVDNASELLAVIDQHAQVKAILWGHVHQEFSDCRNGVQLLGTPSTCIQFLPKSEEFAVDPSPPGFRWIDLNADGTINTGVERLENIPENIELQSSGY